MSSEKEGKVEKKEVKKKVNIKALVAVIPPASEILARKTPKLIEKRVRLRRKPDIDSEYAKINPSLAKAIGAEDLVEVVVAGRFRKVFNVVLDESVSQNEVWCNEELLKEHGVADNSIATIRKAKR